MRWEKLSTPSLIVGEKSSTSKLQVKTTYTPMNLVAEVISIEQSLYRFER